MQRLFFTFVFIFLVRGLLSAQGVLVTSPKSVHDFGVIQEKAGKVTHVFQIKNAGKVPFAIVNVTTGCGCTATKWTKEPIAPGKTGDVSVTYNPEGRPGNFVKSVTVYCTGMKKGYQLRIRGTVESDDEK